MLVGLYWQAAANDTLLTVLPEFKSYIDSVDEAVLTAATKKPLARKNLASDLRNAKKL